MKIGLIDKCPSRVNYNKLFGLDIEVMHLSSQKVQRLKKADVDLEVNFDDFDWIILVGSEALKMYTKITAVSNYTGKRVESKDGSYKNFLVSISPAMLSFKPEMQPTFDATVEGIAAHIEDRVAAKAETDYRPFQSTEEINEYLQMVVRLPVDEYPVVGLDTETTGLYARKCYMLGVSLSHKTHQGIYADADYFDETSYELLQEIVDTEGRDIVLHNMKFDMHMLNYHMGLDFNKCFNEGRLHDTMVMHYVLDERQGTHGLKALVMKFTDMGDYDRELDEFKVNYCKEHGMKQEDFSYDLIPFDIMWKYAAGDTDGTVRLYHKFLPIIKANEKLWHLYSQVMIPATVFLHRVESRGIPLSKKRMAAANKYLHARIVQLEEELYKFDDVRQCEEELGKKFNPNSTQQLRHLLFDVIGLSPTGKMTDSGADSTDAEVLEKLSEQHPVPKLILDIRKTSKLIGSFITKLINNIDKDNRIRTNFGCTTTTSGRLSSSGTFNAQQLPRDNPIIKGCVVARPGYKIVAYDLVTAEVYYAAVLSGDRNLQQVFINMTNEPDVYADFHSTIAHMVFNPGCEPNEVKKLFPALRQASKAVTFGIMFGSGPSKVAESVNMSLLEESMKTGKPFIPCTVEQARGYIDEYFKRFPRLKRWIDSCHSQIRQNGYIYSFYGRKRRLRNYNSADKGIISGEIRSGFNAGIQSASSDSLVLGAMEADNEILAKGLDAQIFAMVHDSVVAEVREDQVEEYGEILIRNVQKDRLVPWSDQPLGIKGCPIGIESDSEEGGSADYSCGKLEKMMPFLAVFDNPVMAEHIANALAMPEEDLDMEDKIIKAVVKNRELCEMALEVA